MRSYRPQAAWKRLESSLWIHAARKIKADLKSNKLAARAWDAMFAVGDGSCVQTCSNQTQVPGQVASIPQTLAR